LTYIAINQGELIGRGELFGFRGASRGSYNIIAAREKGLNDTRAYALRRARDDYGLPIVFHRS
jgi:hypothetical protein